jgi:Putative redox-active protein (C_GCAxxG_C_C)
MKASIDEIVEKAGQRTIAYRRKGFHCSESTFLAINETLEIMNPSLVKMVTGFHGGGGCHRISYGINMNVALEGLASGKDVRAPEEAGLQITGHLCGALAAGVACIGFLYGRTSPEDDLTCVDELTFELHRQFIDAFGTKECRPMRERYVPLSSNNTCEYIYQKGTEIAVRLILEARKFIKECPEVLPIQGIVKNNG